MYTHLRAHHPRIRKLQKYKKYAHTRLFKLLAPRLIPKDTNTKEYSREQVKERLPVPAVYTFHACGCVNLTTRSRFLLSSLLTPQSLSPLPLSSFFPSSLSFSRLSLSLLHLFSVRPSSTVCLDIFLMLHTAYTHTPTCVAIVIPRLLCFSKAPSWITRYRDWSHNCIAMLTLF